MCHLRGVGSGTSRNSRSWTEEDHLWAGAQDRWRAKGYSKMDQGQRDLWFPLSGAPSVDQKNNLPTPVGIF